MSSTDNYADGYDAKIIIEGKDAEIERLRTLIAELADALEIGKFTFKEQELIKRAREAAKHE